MPDNVVDSIIAKAVFDNKEFDSNIKKSQKSLEDFKKDLNFDDASKQMMGFSEASKSILQMAADIGKLTNELTGIGSLSTYVAQKIKSAWQGALGSVKSFANSLTVVQEHAGGDKYDGLLKAVQTIKNATNETEEAVYKVMGDLNTYTDETSYDFADMAQNIGKFTTAGVNLKDAELEMEGIANWAAFAGQGVSEAQRAMYNISQAMSAGYMKLMDYKSIQNAGMDIRKFREEAIKAAVAVGSLTEKNGKFFTTAGNKEVNLDNFTETLQFKWFDRATMEKVFKTFGDNTEGIGAEAYKAAQRCVTFKDALNAIKDMLSTGWMKTYEHIFGRLSEAMNLFSGLCIKASEALDKFVKFRNGVLERWNTGGGRDSLWSAIVGEIETPDSGTLFKGAFGLLDAITSVGDLISNAFRGFIRNFIDPFDLEDYDNRPEKMMEWLAGLMITMTNKVRNFIQGIRDFFETIPEGATESRFTQIQHVVEAIFSAVLLISNVFGNLIKFNFLLLSYLQPTIDSVMSLISVLSQMFSKAVADAVKGDAIGGFFQNLAKILKPVANVINTVVGFVINLTITIIKFLDRINLLSSIGAIIYSTFNSITGIISSVGNFISMIVDRFKPAIAAVENFAVVITSLFKKSMPTDVGKDPISPWLDRLFKAVLPLADVINVIVKFIFDLASSFVTLVGEGTLLSTIGDFFVYLADSISKFISSIINSDTVKPILDSILNFINSIPSRLSSMKDFGKTLKASIKDTKAFKTIFPILTKVFSKEKLQNAWNSAVEFFTNFSTKMPELLETVKSKIVGALSGAGGLLEAIVGGLLNLFSSSAKAEEFGDEVTEAVVDAVTPTNDGSDLLSKIKTTFGTVFDKIKEFFHTLFTVTIPSIFQNEYVQKVKKIITGNNWTEFYNNIMNFLKLWASIKWAGSIGKLGVGFGNFGKGIKSFGKAFNTLGKAYKKHGGFTFGGLNGLFKDLVSFKDSFNTKSVTKNLGQLGPNLLFTAGAIYVVVEALLKLKDVEPKSLLAPALEIVGILAVLLIAGHIAKKAAGNGIALLAIAGSVYILSTMLTTMTDTPWPSIFDAVGKILLIAGMLAFVAQAAGNSHPKGLISLVVAISALLLVTTLLGKMKDPETYWKGVVRLLPIVVMLGALLAIVGKFKVGKVQGVIGLAVAIGLLMIPVKMLAGMELGQAAQGIIGLALIFTMIGVFLVKTKDVGNVSKITGLIGTITALSFIAYLVGKMKPGQALLGFGAIVAIMWSISELIKTGSKISEKRMNQLKSIFKTFAIVIAVVAIAIGVLAAMNVPWEFVASFLGGLSLMVSVIGKTLPALSKLTLGQALKGVLILSAVVAALTVVFSLLAPLIMESLGEGVAKFFDKLGPVADNIAAFATTLSGIGEGSITSIKTKLTTLYETFKTLSGFKDFNSTIDAFSVQMGNIRAGLELLFYQDDAIPDFYGSKTYAALVGIRDLLPSLTTVNIGDLPTKIALLGAGLSIFNQLTADMSSTDENFGLSFLERLFNQAENIKTLTQLPLGGLSSKLSTLGGAMSVYASGAGKLTDVDTPADPEKIAAAVGVLNAISSSLSGEDGSGGFKIPENMPAEGEISLFGSELAALAIAMKDFAAACAGFNTDSDLGLAALTTLGTINTNLTEDKLKVAKVFHNADVSYSLLGEFATCIEALGGALNSFSTLTTGTDFSSGLGALDSLADINSKLTEDKLEVFNVLPNNDVTVTTLSEFQRDIGALGRALASFANSVNYVDAEGNVDTTKVTNFDNAMKAVELFGELAAKLPKTGGLVKLVKGQTKGLDDLGSEIEKLGKSLNTFYTKISATTDEEGNTTGGFEYSKELEDALSVLNELVGINASMPDDDKVDGLKQKIEGHKNGLGDIAPSIGELGTNLKKLSDNLNGTEAEGDEGFNYSDKMRNALLVLNQLVAIQGTIPEVNEGGFIELIKGRATTLGTLSGHIETLGNALSTFSKTLTGTEGVDEFNLQVVLGALTAASKLIEIANSLLVINPESGSLLGAEYYIQELADLFDYLNEAFSGNEMDALAYKISKFAGSISVAFNKNGNIDASALEAFESLANGLTSFATNFNNEEFKSPGEIIAGGIAAGINSGTDLILTTVSTLMASINSVITTDLNASPTITPVLNMTDFETSLSSYGFSGFDTVNAGNAAGRVFNSFDVNVLNPTDLTQVITAVNSVGSRVDALGTKIGNIRIVLNSGPLIGGISTGMDQTLGRGNFYASRRNAGDSSGGKP